MSERTHDLLITGAGVDRTRGIDFPLASTLLPAVANYAKNEGSDVDRALREMLPGLRFSFSSMIARAVESITSLEPPAQHKMVLRVQQVIDTLPPDRLDMRKHGELIVLLFKKLAKITQAGELDSNTRDLIREVFPVDADEIIDSDSVLDMHKLSLSDTFKDVLKRTLRLAIKGDRHEIAEALGADLLNIEMLLVEKFLGFYNDRLPDIKNYIYISWLLWAFLVHKQKEIATRYPDGNVPFYGRLPTGLRAITLNYTSFLERKLGRDNVIYFHGGLPEYVSMSTRQLIPIDEDMSELDPATFLRGQRENLIFDGNDAARWKHVIPALVPPLRLKPILSHRYVELWHKASEWVKHARRIVVVGYSLNTADEHFNDILRQQSSGGEMCFIGPSVHSDYFLERMSKVCSTPDGNWIQRKIQQKPAKVNGRCTLIQAYADEIDLPALLTPQR